MKRNLPVALVLLLAVLAPSLASALDTIRTTKGTTINGTIGSLNPSEVTIKLANGNDQTLSIGEIESIKFSGEPPQLNVARAAALGGRYEEAQRALEKIVQENKGLERAEVQQDVQYWQALCAARLALGGRGDLLAAGKQVREFTQQNPSSHHFLAASELLGDVFVAIDKPDLAQQQYALVERSAPSLEWKLRAGVAQANALAAQGNWDAAAKAYDAALQTSGPDKSDAIETQRQLARLGKAVCLAGQGKPADGITLAQEVIATADPQRGDIAARAYNALGACYRKADRPKDALLAYLHVDVLYPSESLAHAEALKNLAELWPQVGNAQRAAEAHELLRTRYANTKWARG